MAFLLPSLALLLAASITDFRWHEVPDWINYAGLATGVGLSTLLALTTTSWNPLVESIAGILLFGTIGFSMFYTGQWGGGDVKTLIAVGSLLGVWWPPTHTGAAFIANLFPAAALYGLAWFSILLIQHRTAIITRLKTSKHSRILLGLCIIMPAVLLTSPFFSEGYSRGMYLLAGLGIPSIIILSQLVRYVESVAFIKNISPRKLTEGDWLSQPVRYQGKIVVDSGGIGVTLKDIKLLKHLNEKGKLKTVTVKYGLPFVPAFLIALIITMSAGNIFLLLL